jgi:ABC-type nitrate/sulfonate/bicarbonate transport system permease component
MPLRGWYERNERVALGLVGFLVVGLAWEFSVQAGLLKRTFVSSPSAIGQAFWFEAQAGTLWGHVGVSLTEFGLGFGVAAIVGVVIGLVGGWFRRASYIVEPWLAALYATPEIALVPLIILVLGIDIQARVFIVFLTAVFSVAVNTLVGVQSTDARFLDVARSFGASRIRLFASVVLPSTVPFILSGLRIAAGRALVGVVVAELLASNQGLGYLINLAGATLNTGRMMVGVILLGLFGVAIGEALRRVENRFDVWRPVAH